MARCRCSRKSPPAWAGGKGRKPALAKRALRWSYGWKTIHRCRWTSQRPIGMCLWFSCHWLVGFVVPGPTGRYRYSSFSFSHFLGFLCLPARRAVLQPQQLSSLCFEIQQKTLNGKATVNRTWETVRRAKRVKRGRSHEARPQDGPKGRAARRAKRVKARLSPASRSPVPWWRLAGWRAPRPPRNPTADARPSIWWAGGRWVPCCRAFIP